MPTSGGMCFIRKTKPVNKVALICKIYATAQWENEPRCNRERSEQFRVWKRNSSSVSSQTEAVCEIGKRSSAFFFLFTMVSCGGFFFFFFFLFSSPPLFMICIFIPSILAVTISGFWEPVSWRYSLLPRNTTGRRSSHSTRRVFLWPYLEIGGTGQADWTGQFSAEPTTNLQPHE